jgi:UDP-GlcNAc:undecaprenyl-phosphate GlcNAc-1-phosphate transferase
MHRLKLLEVFQDSVWLFIFSAGVSALGTLLAVAIAPRVGLLDRPDGHRKRHGRDVPLGGGVAVFLATVLGIAVWLSRSESPWSELLARVNLLPLLGVGGWIVGVGLVDDRKGLRGRQKLGAQLLGAGVLLACGYYFDKVTVFGFTVDLGILAVPAILFWFLGAMNAVNLLDGADGFAGTLGLMMAVSLGVMAAVIGRAEVATVCFIFAGAIAGFLLFNLPPAKIFLGDAGSMLIGLMIGALSVEASLKGAGTLLLAAPLALWTIPIFDSVAAILRRKLTGKSIYCTDRGHIHHRLLERLGSNHLLLAVIGGIGLVCSAGAIGAVIFQSDWIAFLAGVSVVSILVVGDLFGRGELYLLLRALRRLARPWVPSGKNLPAQEEDTAVHFQGVVNWEPLWDDIRKDLERLGLERVSFDLNIPAVGESFHGRWPEIAATEDRNSWFRVDLPLMVRGIQVGTLSCEGRRNGEQDGKLGALLFEYARELEKRIADSLDSREEGQRDGHPKVRTAVARTNGFGASYRGAIAQKFPR